MPGRALVLHPVLGQRLTLEAMASAAGLSPDLVERFIAYGLVEPVCVEAGTPWFDLREVRRLRTIQRLRNDLGINLAGIAVVFDLLERIEVLQRELAGSRLR